MKKPVKKKATPVAKKKNVATPHAKRAPAPSTAPEFQLPWKDGPRRPRQHHLDALDQAIAISRDAYGPVPTLIRFDAAGEPKSISACPGELPADLAHVPLWAKAGCSESGGRVIVQLGDIDVAFGFALEVGATQPQLHSVIRSPFRVAPPSIVLERATTISGWVRRETGILRIDERNGQLKRIPLADTSKAGRELDRVIKTVERIDEYSVAALDQELVLLEIALPDLRFLFLHRATSDPLELVRMARR